MMNGQYAKYNRRRRKSRRFRIHYGRLARFFMLVGLCVLGVHVLWRTVAINRVSGVFAYGVQIDGVHVGGQSYEAVHALLSSKRDAVLSQTIHLTYEGRSWPLTLDDIDGTIDVEAPLRDAWQYGHTGSWFDKYNQISDLNRQPHAFNLNLSYNTDKLYALITQIKREIDIQPVDADVLVLDNGEITYTDSSPGRVLDAERLINQVLAAIQAGEMGAMALEPDIVQPKVHRAVIEGTVDYRVSFYSTPITSASDSARFYNIRLAFEKINGTRLADGETFSFNQVVGERSAANGFRPAPEYFEGETKEGIGGGVCQASSTLYGAVLRADLNITERNPHSMTVDYVGLGQDAAVFKTSRDLKFVNNTGADLWIFCEVRNLSKGRGRDWRAAVRIIGRPMDYEIKVESIQVGGEVLPSTYVDKIDYSGEYTGGAAEWYEASRPGKKGFARLAYYDKASGALIRTRDLPVDTYSPANGVRWIPAEAGQ